ncbi:hypothetical protein BGS_1344 [Beggiatoa sp. SS]|nr:hypothetical protein BGS_1344 [Beggiatoa sp. SS]
MLAQLKWPLPKSGSRPPPFILKLREEPMGSGQWHPSYYGFTMSGDYIINFNPQSDDNRPQRCVIQSTNKEHCFITLEVVGTMTHASLNGNRLYLPALAVPDDKGGGKCFFKLSLFSIPIWGLNLISIRWCCSVISVCLALLIITLTPIAYRFLYWIRQMPLANKLLCDGCPRLGRCCLN